MCLVFAHFWHRDPKAIGISLVMRAIRCLCYVNEVTFWTGMGLVVSGANQVIRGLEISVPHPPPPPPPQQGRADRGELIASGCWFNQSCLCNANSMKIKGQSLENVRVGEHMKVLGEWKLHTLTSCLTLCLSFNLALEFYPLIFTVVNQILLSKEVSWVPWVTLAN